MTTTDMLNRVNDAIRSGDQNDLDVLAAYIDGLMIEESLRAAWLALIETAQQVLEGEFA